jgi:hypothetical protein
MLVDSRLRSTLSQLVSSGVGKSNMILRLLSPGRHPIRVSTVITRFVLPDDESAAQLFPTSGHDDTIYIPLQFNAAIDVRVFGESSMIELSCPVAMSGSFDRRDGLLNAVDVCFDCANLLQAIIDRARFIVKFAMTRAASLSVQIAGKHAARGSAESSGGLSSTTPPSMPNRLGSGRASMRCPPGVLGDPPSNDVLRRNFTPTCGKQMVPRNGVLRKSSYGLLRDNTDDDAGATQAMNDGSDIFRASTDANATFDLGGGGGRSDKFDAVVSTIAASVVRFQSPAFNLYSSPPPSQVEQIQTQTPQRPRQDDVASSDEANGNIHPGLFSWLRNDNSKFPNDAEVEEQAMIERL